jgi:hypothetical protein
MNLDKVCEREGEREGERISTMQSHKINAMVKQHNNESR